MSRYGNINPYDLHKRLVNHYMLKKPGDTEFLLQRDTSKDKTDLDVIRENHQFIWDDKSDTASTTTTADTWEKQLARKYYEKLFKEYCICELVHYKKNAIALRWRTGKEVVSGKGQFICGNRICSEQNELRSWEVNFAYVEMGQRKNALVKLRLCPDCSKKLNYRSQRREIKRIKKSKKLSKYLVGNTTGDDDDDGDDGGDQSTLSADAHKIPNNSNLSSEISELDDIKIDNNTRLAIGKELNEKQLEEQCWKSKPQDNEEFKSREEEFDEYLSSLLL